MSDRAGSATIVDTGTACVELNSDGLVVVTIRDGARQSIPDAQANLAAALSVLFGRRRPLLVDIRKAQPLDAAVRHQYCGPALAESFLALALLVEGSPLGHIMGNVYLRVAHAGIPTQLFDDERRAVEWLITHRG